MENETMTVYEAFRPFVLIAVGFLLNEFLHRQKDKAKAKRLEPPK